MAFIPLEAKYKLTQPTLPDLRHILEDCEKLRNRMAYFTNSPIRPYF